MEKKMQNRVIKLKDYDNYFFQLPVRAALRQKNQSIVRTELEKRHPCFNEEFCYDAVIKFRKWKLWLDVVVIRKIKLWDYKNKVRLPGFGFFLENKKGLPRFTKLRYMVPGIAVIILVSGILFLENRKQRVVIDETAFAESVSAVAVEKEVEKVPDAGFYAIEFLNLVRVNNGKINSFIWNVDAGEEDINASLKNVYPEVFKKICENCDFLIRYEKNIPVFQFHNSWHITDSKVYERGTLEFVVPELRKLISEKNGVLINEKYKPLSFQFEITQFKNIFHELFNLLEEKKICINGVEIRGGENQSVNVTLFFSENPSAGASIPLFVLDEYEEVFLQKKNQEITVATILETKKQEMNKKFGSISYGNGKTLIFYKTIEGKIISVEEEYE